MEPIPRGKVFNNNGSMKTIIHKIVGVTVLYIAFATAAEAQNSNTFQLLVK